MPLLVILFLAAASALAQCPRTLRLATITEVAGRQTTLPISLISTGGENALSFTLTFDPTRLTYLGQTAGTGATGTSLFVNTNQAAAGALGLMLAKPAGQSFAAGSNELARLRFLLASSAATTTVSFADSVLPREVVDIYANDLCANYSNAPVAITPLILPAILTDPASQTVQPITNIATNVTFSVSAGGSLPLGYQWRWGGANLAGASRSALTLTNVGPAQAGNYDVVVTNDGGAVTSQVAVLTLLPPLIPPALLASPRSQLVSTGETVYLTVAASGSAPLRYQWQRYGAPLAQATDAVLALTNITLAQAGDYRVAVSNFAGGLISPVATLTVSANLRLVRIASTAVATAGTVEVPVELVGLGDESSVGFSLHFDPAALSFRGVRLGTGAAGAGLLLNTNSLAAGNLGIALTRQAGQTFASGTNQLVLVRFVAGNVDGPTALVFGDQPVARELADVLANPRPASFRDGLVNILATAPSITQSPTNLVVPIFSPALFQAAVTGSTPLSYQWRWNGADLPGATSSALTLDSVTPAMAGSYRLIVTNAAGSATSAVATLTVPRVVRADPTNGPTGNLVEVPIQLLAAGDENALGFSLDFDPAQMTAVGVAPGAALAAAPGAPASSPLSLSAYPNNSSHPSHSSHNSSAFFGHPLSGATLNFNTNRPGHIGVVVAQPDNTAFAVGTQEVARIQFLLGQQPGTNRPAWSDLPVTRDLADTNASSLAVQFQPGAVGIQLVPPLVTRQPVPQTAWLGESVSFDLAVSGSQPMSWQWQKNGVDLPGATNATLLITNVQSADAGNYSVRIRNAVNSVSSASALLTVLTPRPDLFVNAVTAPATAAPGQTAQVTWKLYNNGNAAAPAGWWHSLWLASDTAGDNPQFVAALQFTHPLAAGQSLSVTGLVTVPTALLGDRFFLVQADATNDVAEVNENNNTALAAQSTHLASGDLALAALSAPPNAQLGQTLPVTWVVTNLASTPVDGPWQDRLYLATSPDSLAGAISLLTVQSLAPTLAPGAAYTNTQLVALPANTQISPGTWYLTALADSLHQVTELTRANNAQSVPLQVLADYLIAASNHPSAGGTVTGTGYYLAGVTSVLTAAPAPGYKFLNWTEDGNIVGLDPTLRIVVDASHSFVANYAEANVTHLVSTATSPAGVATVTGAGVYTNGQSALFSAPAVVVSGGYDYFFQQFVLTNTLLSTNTSFAKTFSTLDATNLQYTAVYARLGITPLVTNVTASRPNPVVATPDFQLAFRFDRSMDTNFTPQVRLTNSAPGAVQPVVPAGGSWALGAVDNDTFYPSPIALAAGMDGRIQVFLSGAQDTLGVTAGLTNVYTILLDATPPALSNITTRPAVLSAFVTWDSDEPAASLVEYGTTPAYGLNSGWANQWVTAHGVTLYNLAPLTTYHYRIHARDQAGNETISGDYTFTTYAAPDLQVANLSVSGDLVSGGNLLLSWGDTNAGSGATFTSWYDRVIVTNSTTGQTLRDSSVYYDAGANGNLAAGDSRSRQLTVQLPNGPAGVGDLRVLVTVNAYGNQYETNAGGHAYDNNTAALALSSTLAAYPDLQVTGLAVTNLQFESGKTVGLVWNDANTGNGAVSNAFYDRIVVVNQSTAQTLVNTTVAEDTATAPLPAGQALARQFAFVLPDGAAGTGTLQITVTADAYNQVSEYNAAGPAESNNSNAIAAVAVLASYPDLAVTNVVAPATANAGQAIAVTWTETNPGAVAATNTWYDQVFLTATNLVGGGQLLGTFACTNGLAAGQSAQLTRTVSLPQFVQGNQWLVVKANASASFFELDTANNSGISTQAVVVTPTLVLSLSQASVSESAGTNAVLATLARNGDISAPLTALLTTATGTNLVVPATITIPAGQSAARFWIGPIDYSISGPPLAETVTATTAGFPPAAAALTILEDDLATLTLTLSASAVREDAAPGAVTATVTRNVNFDKPVTVSLASDLPTALTVPNAVIIPAGAASATFNLAPVNDNIVGDTRRVHVLASVPGLSPVSAALDVLNVNFATLGLQLADAAVTKGAPNPATTGVVSRKLGLSAAQNIALTVPDNALITVPSVVTIPANATSASFSIRVGDDQLASGPQTATILAQAMTPLGVVLTNGQAAATLTVLDTHGPSLSVSFAAASIAKGSNTVATITRNTAPTNALLVSLSASPSDAVSFPATVLIPSGQASATCTVTGVLDNKQTGPRQVTLTASATGFNAGVGALNISDIYLPDLTLAAIEIPTNGLTQHPVTVSWIVSNQGLAGTTGTWGDYVYLVSDSVGQNPTTVAMMPNPGPLSVGASYTNQATFYLPETPGDYRIEIVTDGQGVVNEINRYNNTLYSAQTISVQPAYRAELTQATPAVASAGTPIVLTGRTYDPVEHSAVPNSSATVRVMVYGTRRVFNVVSDANGNFAYTFQPLSNEAGNYTAGADYPQITTDSNQVAFALLGMQAAPATLNAQLLPNTPLTNQLVLSNLCDHALSGLAVVLPDLQGNLDAQFIFTNTTLPGDGVLTVSYVLQSKLTRATQMKFSTVVTSAEGARLTIPTVVNVTPLVAQLNANPAYLTRGMLVGAQTLVAFDIINTGGADSGDLTVQLPPSLPWLTLSSPATVPSIPPGGKATVTLALNPPRDLPLTLYTGNLVASSGSVGVSVPFQFRAVSDGKGDLRVTATDDYTYYVANQPKVTNATVTVRDAITSAIIAQTNSDQNGIAYFSALPEGPYTVDATAPQHNQYRSSASVVTGTTNELEAFMSRQLVSYQWTVVPTEIPDHYTVQLESVFETEVPVPNVVIDQPQVMLFVWPYEAAQVNLTLRNQGLIAAQNVSFSPPEDPDYIITPLVANVGTIPAQSEVVVPVTVELRAAPSLSVSTRASKLTSNVRPRAADLNSLCGCLKQLNLNVTYSYPCGGNNVGQQRSSVITPLCGPVSAKKCIDNITKVAGSQNWVSLGCNTLTALMSCAISLDPCVKTALSMACGAAVGGVAGAASSGASSVPACICAHLPTIPLPTFPPSPPPDLSNVSYGGGGNFGYYASGFPVVTGYIIDTACPQKSPQTAVNTVRQVVRAVSPLRLQAPVKANTAGGVCAQVRLRINQDVVLTRTAFTGTLQIENNGANDISGIQVDLTFQDATNGVAADKFVTEGPKLTALSAVDGTGSLAAGASGSAVYTFIPTTDAAPNAPATFQIGGTLRFKDNGQPVTVPLLSAPITVYPEARLNLVYFQQRDVYADDPFTPQIEPSEPFALGLIVKNVGAGNAHNFTITSGQPQIIENEKGLLIDFKIIGTQVGDQPISPSLTATLGDISPGAAKEVNWDLVSSLQGKFIEFDATFTHVNDLGRTDTSLIKSVEIHSLTHKVLANRSTDDTLPDFLVNDIPNADSLPDTLYLSDGSLASVNVVTNGAFDGQVGPGHLQVHLTASVSDGWNYFQLPDPGAGYLLHRVVRSDGKVLSLTNNAWTTSRSFPSSGTGAVYENLLHLFDWAGPGAYTLYYHSTNTTPPALLSLGPVTPFNQSGAVSAVDIAFSEPVDTTTFSAANLVLSLDDGPNLLPAGAAVSLVLRSNTTYSITGLAPFTAADGNYQLTVNGSGIYDLWDNEAGNVSVSTQWAKGNVAPVVQGIAPISPNPRNTPLTSATVTFSKAIDPATFDYQALSLTRNGGPNLITSEVTVTPQAADAFLIGGLGPLTGAEGDYVLSINAAAVQDTDGTAGKGSQSVTWRTITTGPVITALEQVTTNPRNVVVRTLNVTFSEPIAPATFDYHALTLTRDGGPNLITSQVTVTQLNPTTFQVGNFSWVQGYAGTYAFTVNAAGLADLAGNPGTGSASETWQIILETPAAPTHLSLAPDLGISAKDGLTSTNHLTLSGTVATTNLTVRVGDVTTGTGLGTATVAGTNFSMAFSLTSQGAHRLQVTAIDVAGNVSAPVFFDLFLDQIPPTAIIQQVTSPAYAAVPSIPVVFSKPINTNTLSATNFTVTLNDGSLFIPTLTYLSSNTCLLGNLAAATDPLGFYQVALNLGGVQDLAGNQSTNIVTMLWVHATTNLPPILSTLTNLVISPDDAVRLRVKASDPNGDPLTYSLSADSPSDAIMVATNGLLYWRPTRARAESTNQFTVVATDNGSPSMSATQSFTVVVLDYLEVSLGSTNLLGGESASLPVYLASNEGVTNLVFAVGVPESLLTNWTLTSLLAPQVGSVTLVDQTTNLVIALQAAAGQSLQGTQLISHLSFLAATNQPSAFVSLPLLSMAGLKASGSAYSNYVPHEGWVAVVQEQPLLAGTVSPQLARLLAVYGRMGTNYQVQYKTNPTLPEWQPLFNFTQTNRVINLGLEATNPVMFYRLEQQ